MHVALISTTQQLFRCGRGTNPLVLPSWHHIRRSERSRFNGILAPSAEHAESLTITVFETHSVSGCLRISLITVSIDLALGAANEILEAAVYLGLEPAPPPSAPGKR